MRGDLVLTNGVYTGKNRTLEEAAADFEAVFIDRRVRNVQMAFSGTPPRHREYWFEARDQALEAARQPLQYDAHMETRSDFSHKQFLEILDEKQAKRERYR